MAFWQSQLGQRTYFAASSLPGMPVLSVSAFGFERAGSPVPALARRIAEERLEQAVAKAWDKDLGASPAEYLDSLRGLDEVIDALAAGRVTSWSINLLSMSSRSTFSTMEDDYDPPNSPPWAEGDINNYVLHDTLGQCASVLDNDSDYDGPQPLTAIKKSDPARGTLSLNSDGTFTYLPTPNLEYYDSFTYAAFDGADESNVETVWVTVTNEYPVEEDDPQTTYMYHYNTVVGTPLVIEEGPRDVDANDVDPDGDEFDVYLHRNAEHGNVVLNADGSFRYTPEPTYEGPDSFEYYGDDHVASDFEQPSDVRGVARIAVVRPIPDIDTDSDNDGTIQRSQYEDDEEMKSPGRLLLWNIDDDDRDDVPDREEWPLLDTQTGLSIDDDELFPALLDIESLGADLTGCTLTLSRSDNLRLWGERYKLFEMERSFIIGVDSIPPLIYVEGYEIGPGTVTWTLKNPLGQAVNSDTIRFTVVTVDLDVYHPFNPPLTESLIDESLEDSPGAGIRRNGDDDNGNWWPDWTATDLGIEDEDDLLRLAVNYLPTAAPGVYYTLDRATHDIAVYEQRNKTGEVIGGQLRPDLDSGIPLHGPGDYFVEWLTAGTGRDTTTLSLTVHDSEHFHSVFSDSVTIGTFTSIITMLGGEGSPPPNGSGMFALGAEQYQAGYNVYVRDEDDVHWWDGGGPAYDEIVNQVQNQGITNVAIMGHSHGGGATFQLAQALAGSGDITVPFSVPLTGYVDAVTSFTGSEENRRPPLAVFHCSQWQTNNWPNGGPSGGNDDMDRSYLGVVQTTIDDDPNVLDLLKARWNQRVPR